MPPTAAISNYGALPDLNQIDLAPIHAGGLRSGSHRNHPVLTPSPVPVRPFPIAPSLRPEVLAATQGTEVTPRGVANQHDIPAVPAIPAIRPALRHMSLPPKRDAPVPAGAALDPDFRAV
jgi:hypothetical protein